MSYGREKSPVVPLVAGALILLAAIAGFAWFAFNRAPPPPKLDTPAGVEQALLADPVNAPIYTVMKRTFPEDFALLTRGAADFARTGKPRWQIDDTILNALYAVEKRHRRDLTQASPAALAAYRKAQIRAIEALKATGPAYCATFLNTGQMHLPDQVTAPASALADLHVAILNALAEGRDNPVGRKFMLAADTDWALVDKTMVGGGIDQATVRAFFDPAKSHGLSADTQCSAGLAFMRAIDSLPADRIDPFFIGLINSLP